MRCIDWCIFTRLLHGLVRACKRLKCTLLMVKVQSALLVTEQGSMHAGAPAMVAAEPDSAVQAPASSGKLNLRKRKAAAAKGAAASAVRGGVKGKPRPAVGLDVPYTWGK